MTQGDELDYEKQGLSETKNLKFDTEVTTQIVS